MGCAKFGERWDKDEDQLMLEAYEEAMADAGIEASQIDAAWLGAAFDAHHIGPSRIPLAAAPRPPHLGVTKLENYCPNGTDSFRRASYPVAHGPSANPHALGVERHKDPGPRRLPGDHHRHTQQQR